MALSQEELEYLGKYRTLTSADEDGSWSKEADLAETKALRVSMKGEKKGFVAEGIEDIKGIGSEIAEDVAKRSQKQGQIRQDLESGKQGNLRSIFQTMGNIAGGVSNAIGSTVIGGIKALAPQGVEEATGDVVKAGAEKVLETDTAQKLVNWYSNLDEAQKRDVGAVAGITSLATDVLGAGLLKKPATQAIKGAVEVGTDVLKTVPKTIQPLTDVITRVPSRIATNIGEKQAQRQLIKELPSKALRDAAREGVDLADLKAFTGIPSKIKPQYKKLVDAVKKYSADKTSTNPIEIIGKPMVKAIQKLKLEADEIGKMLDRKVSSLKFQKMKNKVDLGEGIDETLRNIGITIKNGKLNLRGSQLEGLGGNEGIIQNVYKRFVSSGDASDLHRLKKYIDDNVEFGKTAEGLTGSAERLLKDWRKRIDDALDNQFPEYKKLNDEYKRKINPINNAKKFLKGSGLDEDLLSMKAGALARRLTSNAPSGSDVRQLLRDIDNGLKTNGKISISLEKLQEIYNVLERYYDIAQKTGFKGQIESAITKVGDIPSVVIGKVGEIAGKTAATRQKALEKVFNELFNQ